MGDLVTSVNLLASLQQVQSMLTSMYPTGAAATGVGTLGSGDASSSDSSTIASFEQILAALSPTGSTASGIMGAGMTGTGIGATSSTDPTASSGPTGADVVADAKKYLGVPYVLDGESTKGMDCSGLVQQTYKDLGITLGRGVHEQMTEGTAVPSLAQAQPGDLIVFKGGGHVAIYEGNDTVIHAPMPGRVVQNEKLWVGDSGIQTIRRIVPSAGTTSGVTSDQTTDQTTATAGTTSSSSVGTTSAAVQAAALAAVQAIIQADFGLLSSPQSASSSLDGSATSPSSQIASALQSFESASGIGSTTAATTTPTTSTTSSQQALAMEQSILAQEQL
jgi:cell wall-associated NlpC family hydrolase